MAGQHEDGNEFCLQMDIISLYYSCIAYRQNEVEGWNETS